MHGTFISKSSTDTATTSKHKSSKPWPLRVLRRRAQLQGQIAFYSVMALCSIVCHYS